MSRVVRNRDGGECWRGRSRPALAPESAVACDITMTWLRSRGVSCRLICLYLNVHGTTLKARFGQMPAELRDRYAAIVHNLMLLIKL